MCFKNSCVASGVSKTLLISNVSVLTILQKLWYGTTIVVSAID